MGLFSKQAPEPPDRLLVELLTGYEERDQQKVLERLVNIQQKLVLPITTNLRDGERSQMLVIEPDVKRGNVVLITDQRSIEFRNMGNKEIEHTDIADFALGTMRNGNTGISIESNAARLDYKPTDVMRFEKIIVFEVALPRMGEKVREVLTPYLSLS